MELRRKQLLQLRLNKAGKAFGDGFKLKSGSEESVNPKKDITDIYETMGNYDKEILLLQGELSKTNELQDIYFNKAAETFPNMKWEIVDGANHAFSEKSGERALEKCIDYMLENME